jgi:hypothetical protein
MEGGVEVSAKRHVTLFFHKAKRHEMCAGLKNGRRADGTPLERHPKFLISSTMISFLAAHADSESVVDVA